MTEKETDLLLQVPRYMMEIMRMEINNIETITKIKNK